MPDTIPPDTIPPDTIRPDDTTQQDGAYNYAYLDEQTKRMIRRAILKAVAVPGGEPDSPV